MRAGHKSTKLGWTGPIPVRKGEDGVCTISLASNNAALVAVK